MSETDWVNTARFSYITWREAILMKADGALAEIKAVVDWAMPLKEISGARSMNNAPNFIDTFYLNLKALADAPMEPEKNSGGHYGSYHINTGEVTETSYSPFRMVNLQHIVLSGDNLRIGDLTQALASLQSFAQRNVRPQMPSIEKFVACLSAENQKLFNKSLQQERE